MEIDFGLINIPYYLTNTSWINVLTGLSYRQSNLFYPAEVPYEEWTFDNPNWSDKFYFSVSLNYKTLEIKIFGDNTCLIKLDYQASF